MAQGPSLCENPYDGQECDSPASAYQGETRCVGSETSWNRQEEVGEADGEYFVHFQGSRGETEGGCEDLGEYPSSRNPLFPLDPDRRSSDHTSEMSEAQGGDE